MNDLPAAVKATLQQAAGTGSIQEIEKEASGIYSADVLKDGQKFDVEIAADGKLIKNEADEDDQGNEAKEADKENEEVVMALNDIPAAVAQTIKREAGSGTIGKIEKDEEDGKVEYSAEITKDGKKMEIDVAADGKLIKTEADESGGLEDKD